MDDFNIKVTSAAKVLALILITIISIAVLMGPILAPEKYALPLQAARLVACFARGAIVPMLWDMKPYLLIEFTVALISVVYIIMKHCELPVLFIQTCTNNPLVGPTQTPLSFPIFWSIAAFISFIGFEAFFFLVVRSSKELGFFGQFHIFLWTLLKSLRVGAVEVMKVVARMLYGFVNMGEDREDQLLNLEEGVERQAPVGGPPIGGCSIGDCAVGNCVVKEPPTRDLPVGDCPVEELEANPPPLYVSTFPSIMFTAHQDSIMQYTIYGS